MLLRVWDEAGAGVAVAGVDELVELEDPPEAQPDSNASIAGKRNRLIAPDLGESRILHMPLLNLRPGPRAEINTEPSGAANVRQRCELGRDRLLSSELAHQDRGI